MQTCTYTDMRAGIQCFVAPQCPQRGPTTKPMAGWVGGGPAGGLRGSWSVKAEVPASGVSAPLRKTGPSVWASQREHWWPWDGGHGHITVTPERRWTRPPPGTSGKQASWEPLHTQREASTLPAFPLLVTSLHTFRPLHLQAIEGEYSVTID